MKYYATITRITDGIVYAKTDNRLGEAPESSDVYYITSYHKFNTGRFNSDVDDWKKAEAERKELPLSPDYKIMIGGAGFTYLDKENFERDVFIDDTVEVEEVTIDGKQYFNLIE